MEAKTGFVASVSLVQAGLTRNLQRMRGRNYRVLYFKGRSEERVIEMLRKEAKSIRIV